MRWWTAGLAMPLSVVAVVMATGCAAPAAGHAAAVGPSESRAAVAAQVVPSPATQVGPSACTARQFLLGKVTHAIGFGAAGTGLEFVVQPARNVGGTCELNWPGTMSVAPAAGAFQSVKVSNAGYRVSYVIPAGHELSFVVGAWWAIPGSPSECRTAVINVTAARIPLAAGSIEVALGTEFPDVCRSSSSMSLQIKAAN